VIVPAEVHTPERVAAIQVRLRDGKGWTAADADFETMRAARGEKERLIAQCTTGADGAGRVRLVVVQESFMPPVQSFLDFLKGLRSALGAKGSVHVGLIGKPNDQPFGKPPKAIEFDVWRKKVIGLGDPNIEVLSFVDPE
jgi:hypothetical protein